MRYWTVDEARAYLPRLRELLESLRRASPTAKARGNGHVGGEPDSGEVADVAGELEAGGIVVRDVASGLVDFPAVGDDGVVYFLCWRLTDAELGWWHSTEEGFANRKPLPRRPGG